MTLNKNVNNIFFSFSSVCIMYVTAFSFLFSCLSSFSFMNTYIHFNSAKNLCHLFDNSCFFFCFLFIFFLSFIIPVRVIALFENWPNFLHHLCRFIFYVLAKLSYSVLWILFSSCFFSWRFLSLAIWIWLIHFGDKFIFMMMIRFY